MLYTILMVLISTASAQAGSYAGNANRENYCNDVGLVASQYYSFKKLGYTSEYITEGVRRDNSELARILINVSKMVWGTNIRSENEAQKRAWVMCMDAVSN